MHIKKFSKNHFFIIQFKKLILPSFFLIFTICLLIFSKSNLSAVKFSLSLWVNSVIPSLFPFFVATELLMHTNIIKYFGFLFKNLMRPLFNLNGECAFVFIIGIISGYPIGANLACEFRKKNICSKIECERLLSFTNNSGPLFIIGAVGISMFGNTIIGILLFLTHLLSSITVGIIFRFWNTKNNISLYSSLQNDVISKKSTYASFSNLGEILAESIKSATSTIFMIGGFIVIFACVISILKSSGFFTILSVCFSPIFNFINIDTSFITPIFTSFLEITNGISLISNIHIKAISINIILTAFFLGFGGFSILLQVLSIVSKTDLSIKPYIIGKFLHGLIASFYTFAFIQLIPFFNFNL